MPLGSYTSAAFTTATGVAVAANADVEVRRESDSGLASIFSDRAGATAITQPGFQTDSEGRFVFYAAGISGGYQVKVTKSAEQTTARFQATGLARELDADPFWASVWSAATKLAARIAQKAMGLDGLVSRATNTILAAADSGKAFVATGTFTQTLDAAVTLSADWHVHYRVNAGQTVTLDPNAAETIDGAATKVLTGPVSGVIVCDGSAFFSYGFDQPNANQTVRGIVELATQAEADAGTADRVHTTDLNKIAMGTPIATTSGTAHDFTGIPAGTRRVTINLSDLSTNGTSVPIIQLGDAGGIESTGYSGSAGHLSSGAQVVTTFTTGFGLSGAVAATTVIQGSITLSLLDASANTWVASYAGAHSDDDVVTFGGGTKTLSGGLDRVRLTTVNGTDTFDLGSVNIQSER